MLISYIYIKPNLSVFVRFQQKLAKFSKWYPYTQRMVTDMELDFQLI